MSAGSASLIAPSQAFGRQGGPHVEVRDLGEGVDAGVGPARAVQLEVARAGGFETARSISPWTVRAFFWICQPL